MDDTNDTLRQRRFRRLIYRVVLPIGVLLFVIYGWYGRERSDNTMRLSDVLVLQRYLYVQAEQDGKYPPTLDVIPDCSHPAVKRMEYFVAGKPFPLDSSFVVFREKDVSRYWLAQNGRWVARERDSDYETGK